MFYALGSLSVLWGFISWLPTYLVQARGVTVAQSGWMTALPYVLGAILALLCGFMSDRFDRQAPFCVLQMLGAGVFIFLAASVENAMASVLLMAVGFGFWGFGTPMVHTLLQRIVPPETIATATGIENGIANLGASSSPALIGFFVASTGSYFAGLMVLVAFAGLGAIMMLVLALQKY
jgi:sugar phosphate permease